MAAGVRKDRALLMCVGERAERQCASSSWNFVLEKKGAGTTRLLFRSSARSVEAYARVLGPGIHIMNRGMLLGIRQKAEGKPADRSLAERVSFACVLVAALGSVAMLLTRGRRPWTLAAASAGASLTTLVFFVFYPPVVCGASLASAVIGALLWACRPQRARPAARRRVA